MARLILLAAVAGAIATAVALMQARGSYDSAIVGRSASAINERPVASPTRLERCGASGIGAGTRPARSVILTDRAAACLVQRSRFEPRPENYQANHRVPTAAELRRFRALSHNPYKDRVTGAFTGTTDEILQWAAWKWGIGPDVLRAVAVEESYWHQSAINDGGESFGLMQIKRTYNPGAWPLIQASTAFNVDYYGASLHYYYDGWAKWLGPGYRAGDFWGAVGAYFDGHWHSRFADGYAGGVRSHMGQQNWRDPHF